MQHVPYSKELPILKHLEGLVYRNRPNPDEFENGRTWKEHAIEGDEVLSMIAQTLEAAGCCHGHAKDQSTPPIMFPEWIMCAIAHREKQIKELDAELKVAQTIIATHNLCHDKHGKVGVRQFADSCANEQRSLFGEAPDADLVQRLNILLQNIEWVTAIHDVAQCPCCNRVKTRGHTETCALKLALDRINADATGNSGGTETISESSVQDAEGSSERD